MGPKVGAIVVGKFVVGAIIGMVVVGVNVDGDEIGIVVVGLLVVVGHFVGSLEVGVCVVKPIS